MKNEVVDNYYTSQKLKLLKEFDKVMRKYGRKILASYYGDDLADTVIKEGRQEYEALIPQLPYVGGKKNPWTKILVQCTGFLAVYRARAHVLAPQAITSSNVIAAAGAPTKRRIAPISSLLNEPTQNGCLSP